MGTEGSMMFDGQHDLADAHGKLVVQRFKLGKERSAFSADLRLCLLGSASFEGSFFADP